MLHDIILIAALLYLVCCFFLFITYFITERKKIIVFARTFKLEKKKQIFVINLCVKKLKAYEKNTEH